MLDEAKSAYEEARASRSVGRFIDSSFKLEEARIKYLVLQEIGTPDKQPVISERLRAVNQLMKLVNDGKIAVSARSAPPAPEPSPDKSAPPDLAPKPDSAGLAAPAVDVMKRHPVPEAKALKDAEKVVREMFKAEYPKKAQADRAAFAKSLLQMAGRTRGDPAGTWVLCREAQDIAVQAGDVQTALATVDEMARTFDVDAGALRMSVLAAVGKTAKQPQEFRILAESLIGLVEELIATDQYDAADKAAVQAQQHARRAGDVALALRVTSRAKDVTEAKTRFVAMKGVLETLARTPDDPGGNHEMGQFLCFVKGSWDLGLRFLAKGSDPLLKALAEKELATPLQGAEWVSIADGWYELIEKEKNALRKSQMVIHCRLLYEGSLPAVSGLVAVKVEKRLAELHKMAGTVIDLLALIDPVVDAVQGTFLREGKALILPKGGLWDRIEVPYAPPEEYDLTLVVERKDGSNAFMLGLVSGGRQFAFVLDGWAQGDLGGLDFVDGKGYQENETQIKGRHLPAGKQATLLCSVRKEGVTVSLDSRKLVEWKGSQSSLSLHPKLAVRNPAVFLMAGWVSRFKISQMTLIPVSGLGKRTR